MIEYLQVSLIWMLVNSKQAVKQVEDMQDTLRTKLNEAHERHDAQISQLEMQHLSVLSQQALNYRIARIFSNNL